MFEKAMETMAQTINKTPIDLLSQKKPFKIENAFRRDFLTITQAFINLRKSNQPLAGCLYNF